MNDAKVENFPGNIVELASNPIIYKYNHNKKMMKLEFGVGVDNPGFYLKCNGEYHKSMPSSNDI